MCFWYFVGVSRWKEFHLLEQMDQNWILSACESIELNLFPSWEISQLSRKIKRRRNITFDQPRPRWRWRKWIVTTIRIIYQNEKLIRANFFLGNYDRVTFWCPRCLFTTQWDWLWSGNNKSVWSLITWSA